ncbi:hypothetical protein EON65_06280 [archaeon]|nr:MAG: hypothetical protein EON65_06280 [archaeon]
MLNPSPESPKGYGAFVSFSGYHDLGKTPASRSGTCQSSDVSPFFKAAKRKLLGVPLGLCNDRYKDSHV